MERILLAVDGSEHSMRAADLCGELSRAYKATVDVINVVAEDELRSPDSHEWTPDHPDLERLYETRLALLKSRSGRLVLAAARRVEDAGGEVGDEVVAVGNVAAEITDAAKLYHSDCIVMGRRGYGDVRGLLLGSVSHRVGQMSEKTLITTH